MKLDGGSRTSMPLGHFPIKRQAEITQQFIRQENANRGTGKHTVNESGAEIAASGPMQPLATP